MAGAISDPCLFVSFSEYDWGLERLFFYPRGLCHGVSLAFNPTVYYLTGAFHTAAILMSLNLAFQLFFTFKRRNSLYFW
jgi:hypothetical protein